ncbi:MAG: hypothetical protein MRY74_06825 [Neomegalonema sp.]|nr:hypothetical protein [Neomegalonema sp.]
MIAGTLSIGPFPRMGGKYRPAACVYIAANGAAVLCPGTSRKSRQPGRIALAAARLASNKPTWLLAPLATLFPPDSAKLDEFALVATLSQAESAALQAEIAAFYGEEWREMFERRAETMRTANRIPPIRRRHG